MSQHDLIDLFGFVTGIRRIMLIGFGVGMVVVFMTVLRLAVSEHGWAKSWNPTSTRRTRRARAAVRPPGAPPQQIPVPAVVTLRTRIADAVPRPGPS
ncbi:MAG: hypothetical protein ABJB93_12350 [Gaiellales bacterium]